MGRGFGVETVASLPGFDVFGIADAGGLIKTGTEFFNGAGSGSSPKAKFGMHTPIARNAVVLRDSFMWDPAGRYRRLTLING